MARFSRMLGTHTSPRRALVSSRLHSTMVRTLRATPVAVLNGLAFFSTDAGFLPQSLLWSISLQRDQIRFSSPATVFGIFRGVKVVIWILWGMTRHVLIFASSVIILINALSCRMQGSCRKRLQSITDSTSLGSCVRHWLRQTSPLYVTFHSNSNPIFFSVPSRLTLVLAFCSLFLPCTAFRTRCYTHHPTKTSCLHLVEESGMTDFPALLPAERSGLRMLH